MNDKVQFCPNEVDGFVTLALNGIPTEKQLFIIKRYV